jgi:hypothetical protein
VLVSADELHVHSLLYIHTPRARQTLARSTIDAARPTPIDLCVFLPGASDRRLVCALSAPHLTIPSFFDSLLCAVHPHPLPPAQRVPLRQPRQASSKQAVQPRRHRRHPSLALTLTHTTFQMFEAGRAWHSGGGAGCVHSDVAWHATEGVRRRREEKKKTRRGGARGVRGTRAARAATAGRTRRPGDDEWGRRCCRRRRRLHLGRCVLRTAARSPHLTSPPAWQPSPPLYHHPVVSPSLQPESPPRALELLSLACVEMMIP